MWLLDYVDNNRWLPFMLIVVNGEHAYDFVGLCFEKMRFEGLKCMAKAYATKIPVKYVSKILGFAAVDGSVDWLKSHGAVLSSFENGEMALLPKVPTSHYTFVHLANRRIYSSY